MTKSRDEHCDQCDHWWRGDGRMPSWCCRHCHAQSGDEPACTEFVRKPTTMTNLDLVAMAICREKCAFLGEPACFNHFDEHGNPLPWPPEDCDEPGCMALAEAVMMEVEKWQ